MCGLCTHTLCLITLCYPCGVIWLIFCRPTACRFACIGCRWKGPNQSLSDHENECGMPVKSGVDIMAALEPISAKQAEERQLYKNIFSLLSFEKITFHGSHILMTRIVYVFFDSSIARTHTIMSCHVVWTSCFCKH